MTNKGIPEISLFDPILLKMDCHLFEVTTVLENFVLHEKQKFREKLFLVILPFRFEYTVKTGN